MGFLSGLFSDKKTTKSDSTQAGQQSYGLSDEAKNYWSTVAPTFNQGWTPVANDPNQTAAAGAQAGLSSGLNPVFNTATGIGQTGISTADIQRFQNPWEDQVVQNTLDDMRYADSKALTQSNASAAKMGALGGSGGIVRRNLAEEGFQDNRNKYIAQARQAGYDKSADLATKSTQAQLAGLGAASGIAGQQSGINQTQFGMGTQGWNQSWQNANQPYTTAAQGAQVLAGLSPASGQSTSGTSQGTQVQQGSSSPFANFSGLVGLGLSAWSDERVKENIVPIGESFDGQPIYKFSYKGDPRTVIGLMAQDVEEHTPEAVGEVDGIKTVDYDMALEGAEKGRSERPMADGGAVGGQGQKDPHAKFKSAFEAISGLMERARGGSISGMAPARAAGGPIGSWSTTVTPASTFDSKAFGAGLQKLGPSQGDSGSDDTSILQQQQQSLSSMLSGMSGRRAVGGGVWDEGGPEFGGSSGIVPVRPSAVPDRVERRPLAPPRRTWTSEDPTWQGLSTTQRAAAMGLLEADGRDPTSARNAISAMVNRANRTGEDLGSHVSRAIYQPTIEPAQRARLGSIVRSPEFKAMTSYAEDRVLNKGPDPVEGNTHFLAHEPVMEKLRAREPGKYRSWVNWSGYNRGGGQYTNPDGSPVSRDKSHAFLSPEGRFDGGDPTRDLDENPGPLPPPSTMVASSGGGGGGSRPTRVAEATTTSASGAPVATDAPKRGGWFNEGVWAGEKMTPMQRLGMGLMSIRGPMFEGPMNGMARSLQAMEEGRLREKQVDNEASQFAKRIAQEAAIAAGVVNGQPTVAARTADASIADAEANRKVRETGLTGTYNGQPTVAGLTQESERKTAELKREAAEIDLLDKKDPERIYERRRALADKHGLTGEQRTQFIFDGKIPDKTGANETTETKEITKAAVEGAQKSIAVAQSAGDSLQWIDQLHEISADPGLESAIGPLDQSSIFQSVAGAVGAGNPDLHAKIQRIQKQLELAGGQEMKGLGPQTDADARRLQEAVSNLTSARNKKEFDEALAIIEEKVSLAYNKGVTAAKRYPTINPDLSKAHVRDLKVRKEARDAIAEAKRAGKDIRQQVIDRLISNGIDPAGI